LSERERTTDDKHLLLGGKKREERKQFNTRKESFFCSLVAAMLFSRQIGRVDRSVPSVNDVDAERKNVPCRRKKAMSEVERWPKSMLLFLYRRVVFHVED
jgi:hypothetical protein